MLPLARADTLRPHEPATFSKNTVTGWRKLVKPAPSRGDLNLKKSLTICRGVGPTFHHSFLFETLAEVDFNSYRPPDLTIKASPAMSLSRGAGSQYHTGGTRGPA